MKRLLSAALALTLLGSTAAMADGWHGRGDYRGYGHHDRGDAGAAVAVGLGIATLAIIASQRDRHEGYNRGYNRGYYGRGYRDRGYYNNGYARHEDDDD